MTRVVCYAMLLLTPMSLTAADLSAAMLYAEGSAMLNGAAVQGAAAIVSGDLVQTRPDSTARIQGKQGQIILLPESLLKFDGSAVSLQYGSAGISSSKGMKARIAGVVVTPNATVETKYEISDSKGRVQIIARQGQLKVSDGKGTTLLAEGQQMTAYYQKQQGPPPAASGGAALTPWIIGGAAAAVGAVAIWLAVRDTGSRPVSPAAQ